MSRPDSLTTEELRAVCKMLQPYARDRVFWTAAEKAALDRALDKLLDRLAHRRPQGRSGTAPDPARTR